jgi:hypothetical protein
MRDDDLELFAINTGELYKRHCQLAAINPHPSEWEWHVFNRVIPLYIRQVELRAFSGEEIVATAKGLREYYAQHVKELTTP